MQVFAAVCSTLDRMRLPLVNCCTRHALVIFCTRHVFFPFSRLFCQNYSGVRWVLRVREVAMLH